MIDVFLQKEAEHKASAERAAASGDWIALATEARHLVTVYGAILQSGLVDRSSFARWEGLRKKWQEIGERARVRSLAKAEERPPAKSETAPEPRVVEPQIEDQGEDAPQAKPGSEHPKAGLKLSDVKGLEEAKRIVMKALVNPVRHPDVYRTLKIRSGKGLLLYGPPGTGKTMFARAIAGEMNLPFIYRKASELKDKYVGESEKNVSRLCEEAYSHKQSVVFLDECDELLRKRGNQKVNILGSFLEEMDGFATNRESQVFFLLASNRPWLIDSAIMSRIGAAAHVGLPEPETRRSIIEAALKDVPLAADVDLDELARLTDGYSGRQLAGEGIGICFVAATNAAERWISRLESAEPSRTEKSRIEPITRADFEAAMKSVVPVSVSDPEIVNKNREFSLSGQAAAPGGAEDGSED